MRALYACVSRFDKMSSIRSSLSCAFSHHSARDLRTTPLAPFRCSTVHALLVQIKFIRSVCRVAPPQTTGARHATRLAARRRAEQVRRLRKEKYVPKLI